jgi:chemotaxis protein MotB
MRTRKKDKVDTNLWLNTYADMITLVLVFFILLFSMSSIDQEKYRMLVRAFTADRETIEQLLKYESELGELYVYLRGYVQENDLEASVKVHKGENVVYVRFMSNLFFEPNRAVLKPGGREILDHVGVALAQVEHIARFIRIDGHTAEASPGNDIVNNRDLSTERANAVLKYLEDNYIKDPAKLFAVGYGLHRPVAPNDSEENRAKNRRVEILVGKQDLLQEELEKFYEMTDF